MPRLVRLSRLARNTVGAEAEDVRDDVSRLGRTALREHAQSDLDVGLRLCVRVLFRVLAEPLVDDVVVEVHLAVLDLLPELGKVVVDLFDHDLGRVAGEDLVEYVPAGAGQPAIEAKAEATY